MKTKKKSVVSGPSAVAGRSQAVKKITRSQAVKIQPRFKRDGSGVVLPRPYAAGQTDAGPSLGFKRDLAEVETVEAFFRHPEARHIETPGGYCLRGELYADFLATATVKPDFIPPDSQRASRGFYVCEATGRFYLHQNGRWSCGAVASGCWWRTAAAAETFLKQARLIAQAPELRECLLGFVLYLRANPQIGERDAELGARIDWANAVLNRADGKP